MSPALDIDKVSGVVQSTRADKVVIEQTIVYHTNLESSQSSWWYYQGRLQHAGRGSSGTASEFLLICVVVPSLFRLQYENMSLKVVENGLVSQDLTFAGALVTGSSLHHPDLRKVRTYLS